MVKAEANVKIRPMEPEDISGILEIDRKISGVQRASTYKDSFNEVIGGQMSVSFVAEIDDRVVGFVLAYLTYVREQVSEACRIQIFGVDPQYQKQGIAKKLFQRLLDECSLKKIKLVRVSLGEGDSDLKKLFEGFGFEHGRYIDYFKTL